MVITRRNIGKHEMIGLFSKVSDGGRKVAEGMIIDETKNTFLMRTKTGDKRILKKGKTFVLDVDGGIELCGDLICFRPEDRLKKVKLR
ncbi:MAG: ribonuclease P protein subunit [Candidatus Aenigmarchaeota archaeon]|nr:ribonuclease P protein subunit [Candidatus Aenigmarchaeota archaeon]